MYLTVKQQVKHLSKTDYRNIRELCHIAKNLANQAIYNVRQYYFDEGEYLNYEKNYALLKTSDHYKMLNSNMPCQRHSCGTRYRYGLPVHHTLRHVARTQLFPEILRSDK